MSSLKVLELFAGSRSIGKAAESLGMQVWSVDKEKFEGINQAIDILLFSPEDCPFIPDIVWGSPPCTTFSIAAISTHRNMDKSPKTKEAELGDKLVIKTIETIETIEYFLAKNPKLIWFIENPRGLLRKMPFMRRFKKRTVTYCKYGDDRMKPTDIWTNNNQWQSRPVCRNGQVCHEAAPRGSKTGTQGKVGSYNRSKIPDELCIEVLKSCIK